MSELIAEKLIDIESVQFSFNNHFTLTSGLKSPVYVDCRKIISFVEERTFIMDAAIKYLKDNNLECDLVAGGETAGIPYAAFISEKIKKPMIYIRKKPKGFGKNQQIEGDFNKNQKAILVEDLATDGGSKIIFVEAMRKAGLVVKDIFVIFYYDIFDFEELQQEEQQEEQQELVSSLDHSHDHSSVLVLHAVYSLVCLSDALSISFV